MRYEVKINEADLRDFKNAVRRYPQEAKKQAQQFLTKANAEYSHIIQNNPWNVGESGGGAPVATPESAGYQGGQLRNTHIKRVLPWKAVIYPTVDYAGYVHGGTSKMQERPWLDYAFKNAQSKIKFHEREMIKNLLKHLGD